MARRRRYPEHVPFVKVPRTGPPVISIAELKWNARLGLVTQFVYIAGRLPRPFRYGLALALGGSVLLALELAIVFWRELLALVLLVVLWRYGRPRLERWRQYRRDRAEALEVFGDDEETLPKWPHRGDDGIPY